MESFRVVAVSTHSRPKAAGRHHAPENQPPNSFNTQPPEGGWGSVEVFIKTQHGFNTQPPEGGWTGLSLDFTDGKGVSTHSRPKAAGHDLFVG